MSETFTDHRRAAGARGRVRLRPGDPGRLPARRGLAAPRVHPRNVRHLQAAGARGRHRAQRLVRLRPDGVRAQRGQGPGLRRDADLRRHRRGGRRGGGRGSSTTPCPTTPGRWPRSRTSRARRAGSSIDLDHEMAFNPGQYVTVEVPGTDETRTYSMANPPGEPGRIELQIRRTPGGLATDGWVFKNLAEGDSITLSGPFGRFFLREARPEPMILIGGGTGLAPLKSIVRHVLEQRARPAALPVPGCPRRRPTSTTSSSSGRWRSTTPSQFTYRPCLSRRGVGRTDGDGHRRRRRGLRDLPQAHRVPLRAAADGRGGAEDADEEAAVPEGHLPGGLLRRVRQGDRRRAQPAAEG